MSNKGRLQPRTAFEMYFGREDEGDDGDMYGDVIEDIQYKIDYYEKDYDNWKPLDRPQYVGVYDHVFEMEETIKVKKMYEELTKISLSSSFPPDAKFKLEECRAYWYLLKELMESKHNLSDKNFYECLWLHISGCPRTITTNIQFKYNVCKVILQSVESNGGNYDTDLVRKALEEVGYSESLINRICKCAHDSAYRQFESFTRYLDGITEELEQ